MRLTKPKMPFDNKEYVENPIPNGEPEEIKYSWLFEGDTIYYTLQKLLNKLGQLEDIEEWLSKKIFYGKAANIPNKILELKFEKLDFRPGEDLLLVHFKVLNSWATNIFYSILEYGRTWSLIKEELL